MNKLIKNNVTWVGKIDWELKKFHGEDFSTDKGSSYNSYLIKEEKTVLIDTVWMPFAKEFVANLKEEVDLKKIDFIIAQHGEVDHSGALPELMKEIPDCPIYCTAAAVKSIKGQYHQDWNFNVVKTGDTLDIGNGKKLVFVEMKMLHWPDSMATYMTEDNILFSNDAFGQHYATDRLFNDTADQCDLMYEAKKYYANILNPFNGFVVKKLEEIGQLNLPIDYICTSHGCIWRDNPTQIIGLYDQWSKDYQENQITVIYDTMWNGTKKIAEAIMEGINLEDKNIRVKVLSIAKNDKNDICVEVMNSKLIAVGSPTVGNSILSSVSGFLHFVKELKFRNKKAASFGCYGWSGEGVKILNEELKGAGFDVISEGLRCNWNPDDAKIEEAVNLGRELARAIK